MRIKHVLSISMSMLFLLGAFSSAAAPATKVNFAINSPGSAPYLYYDPASRAYRGVVVDFFKTIEQQGNLKVKYLDSSRARSEQLLQHGIADAFLSSQIWLDNPQHFILSAPLMQHASYMYATTEFDRPFVAQQHPDASVCTRYGFIYPVLQEYFDKKQHGLVRVDSSSQTTMAMMLAKDRCDFANMSEQNALSIMFNETFCDTSFYQSPNVVSAVDLVFVIRPQRVELKQRFDAKLRDFIESGALQSSIAKHSGQHQFPKEQCGQ